MKNLYYTPGAPTAYSGLRRLWKAAKAVNRRITRKQVQDWLSAQDTYTLHKRARKKLSAEPRVYVLRIDQQWAMDLCEVGNISEFNDGYNFILTCIDILSKRADAEGMKGKTAKETAAAFEAILSRTSRRPETVETDHGKEFFGKAFQDLCKRLGIHHFSTQSSNKACVVERFNRSLKELMYKHFYATNSLKWRPVLQDLLRTYNGRFHRSIGMSPDEVNAGNEDEVHRRLYGRRPKRGKRYSVGDMVRISKKKHIFEKGYLPNFTEEVFRILNVIGNHAPYRYELEDMLGEEIEGRFAPEEIQKIIKTDDMWKIEK